MIILLGILGGMGTISTHHFINELIELQKDAACDQDYIDYVLYNYSSVPDRTDHILGKSDLNPTPYLVNGIKKLSLLNPELIVVPCNTAHYYYDFMQAATNIPVLNMVKETVDEIADNTNFQRVLVLATEGSIKCGIYEKKLIERGLTALIPDETLQKMLMTVIYEVVKKNRPLEPSLYHSIVEKIKCYEQDIVLLGCTELASVFFPHKQPVAENMINPQRVAAKTALKRIKGNLRASELYSRKKLNDELRIANTSR